MPTPGMNVQFTARPSVVPFVSGSRSSLPRRYAPAGVTNDAVGLAGALFDHGPSALPEPAVYSARARHVYRVSNSKFTLAGTVYVVVSNCPPESCTTAPEALRIWNRYSKPALVVKSARAASMDSVGVFSSVASLTGDTGFG